MHFLLRRVLALTPVLLCFSLRLPGANIATASISDGNSIGIEQQLAELENRLKDAESKHDDPAAAELSNSIGLLRYSAEQFDGAREAFSSALALYRRLGDERGQATELAELGATFAHKGMARESVEFYQESLPLWRKLDRAREAAVLGRIAEVFRALGDVESALRFNEQALGVFAALGDNTGQAAVLNNIGLSYFMAGKKKKGTEFFNRACAAYHEAGNKTEEAIALNNLAAAYIRSGDQSKALAAYDQALGLEREKGNREEQAAILEKIGVVYSAMGQRNIAHAYYDDALSIYHEMGNHQREAEETRQLTLLDGKRQRRPSKAERGGSIDLAAAQIKPAQ